MANFKGGFAFNNEAAKVEVEQAPDGTLISCVNPVTGESLNAGNYSEVITGTAAAPFGDYTLEELYEGLQAGNVSMVLSIDGTILGQTTPITGPLYWASNVIQIYMSGALFITTPGSESISSAFLAFWNDNSQKLYFYASGTTTNASAYMASLPTTLTIYHHPMP